VHAQPVHIQHEHIDHADLQPERDDALPFLPDAAPNIAEIPAAPSAPQAEQLALRRSTRDRRPCGEWWKAPAQSNNASAHWTTTVNAWASNPKAPSTPRLSKRRVLHEQRTADNRLVSQATVDARAVKGAAAAAYAAEARAVVATDPARLLRPDISSVRAIEVPVPKTLAEALASPYSGYWFDAYETELNNLREHDTFGPPTEPSKATRCIKSKLVFKVKPDASGSGRIQKFKARLCAKGFTQQPGYDFDETFAPTANATSFLVTLALAAQHGLRLRHIDWVAAYLNGVMEHEVYMTMPDGTTRRLIKAIYGTRQGAERWHAALLGTLFDLGFTRTVADPCVFTLHDGERSMILAIHSDDGLIAHNDDAWTLDIVGKLNAKFELIDQGAPSRLLGMRVRREGGQARSPSIKPSTSTSC